MAILHIADYTQYNAIFNLTFATEQIDIDDFMKIFGGHLKRRYRFSLIAVAFLFFICTFLFTACPEPPDNGDDVADCPEGQLPCEDDSTKCCDVECPPGYIVGGVDSTECIPVECPEGYHLGGIDSTECILDSTSHNFSL